MPTRIDTGAGGTAGGSGGLVVAAAIAGALGLVALGARRSMVATRSSETR